MTTTVAISPNTAAYKQTSIYKHLDLLEHLIEDASGVWKFKLINADQFLEVLDKARARLPEELREATEVLQQRDDIIAESQRRAEQIISTARRQAENMVQESELLKAVQAEVDRIRKQVVQEVEQMRREALAEADKLRIEAEEDATRVRDGADHYAEQVLTRIDTDLNTLGRTLADAQQIVRNGQRVLGSVKRHVGVSPNLLQQREE
ncbi:MAG: ATP synthase F0 subunit B [Candidatus Obscuribacterales bacterium]|jgi:F0F1-type ATP synthase membrane subunit b/b'|nr:ATP synthase F0 subunit B [Candidatus Obscuribacterales bacterium]